MQHGNFQNCQRHLFEYLCLKYLCFSFRSIQNIGVRQTLHLLGDPGEGQFPFPCRKIKPHFIVKYDIKTTENHLKFFNLSPFLHRRLSPIRLAFQRRSSYVPQTCQLAKPISIFRYEKDNNMAHPSSRETLMKAIKYYMMTLTDKIHFPRKDGQALRATINVCSTKNRSMKVAPQVFVENKLKTKRPQFV